MREPKLGVAVGKKGVGKTYTTDKVVIQKAMFKVIQAKVLNQHLH